MQSIKKKISGSALTQWKAMLKISPAFDKKLYIYRFRYLTCNSGQADRPINFQQYMLEPEHL